MSITKTPQTKKGLKFDKIQTKAASAEKKLIFADELLNRVNKGTDDIYQPFQVYLYRSVFHQYNKMLVLTVCNSICITNIFHYWCFCVSWENINMHIAVRVVSGRQGKTIFKVYQ